MKLLSPAPHPATFGLFFFPQSISIFNFSSFQTDQPPSTSYLLLLLLYWVFESVAHLVQPDFLIYCLYNLPSTRPASTSSRPMGIKHPKHHIRLDFKYRMLTVPHAACGFQQRVWVISSQGGLCSQWLNWKNSKDKTVGCTKPPKKIQTVCTLRWSY